MKNIYTITVREKGSDVEVSRDYYIDINDNIDTGHILVSMVETIKNSKSITDK